jgi:hypothetical protein
VAALALSSRSGTFWRKILLCRFGAARGERRTEFLQDWKDSMKKTPFVLAAFAAATLLGMAAQPASASPLIAGAGLLPLEAGIVHDAQYVERRIIRRGHGRQYGHDRRVCRVVVTRRHTPRGVVVERVRRCR